MRSQVYLTVLSALRPFLIASFALVLPALGACGGDDDDSAPVGPAKDAGGGGEDEFDATFAPPIEVDAGQAEPGDPPADLAKESCAVDTNKLYDLVAFDRAPEPTRLAVDLPGSRFALAYIDESKDCVDAVYVAQIEGERASAKPDISFALDPCSMIDSAAIEYNGERWLLGTIDARGDARDLWIQEFDPDDKETFPAHNVTESDEPERAFALLSLTEGDGVVAAWVEDGLITGSSQRLKVRKLSAGGEPEEDVVELDQPKGSTWTISGLTMAQFGANYVGLGYRRQSQDGHAELVLDVLDRQGERDRDTLVLSKDAGGYGGIDLVADEEGGGVIYSVVQGLSEQLWFQLLDVNAHVAKVNNGVTSGGAMEALRVVGPPYKANDASLAKLPNGYAVAYRALPGGDLDAPRIRVHFLDRFGRILAKSDVAHAEPTGGRTAIKSAYDGRVVVGWSDQDAAGKTTMTAVRLPCVGAP